MNQISPRTDKIMHKLSREIGEAVAQIEAGEKKKDNAWIATFDLFDEHGMEGKTQFVAEDGYTLKRQERNYAPQLSEEVLRQAIFDLYPRAQATRIWNAITVRKVDSAKLEAAVQRGKLPASLVNDAITPGTKSYARVRDKWTKKDRELAKIYGIERT